MASQRQTALYNYFRFACTHALRILLLRGKLFDDLVENYAKIARKKRDAPDALKFAAARSAAANFVRRLRRVFSCNFGVLKFGVLFNQIVQ